MDKKIQELNEILVGLKKFNELILIDKKEHKELVKYLSLEKNKKIKNYLILNHNLDQVLREFTVFSDWAKIVILAIENVENKIDNIENKQFQKKHLKEEYEKNTITLLLTGVLALGVLIEILKIILPNRINLIWGTGIIISYFILIGIFYYFKYKKQDIFPYNSIKVSVFIILIALGFLGLGLAFHPTYDKYDMSDLGDSEIYKDLKLEQSENKKLINESTNLMSKYNELNNSYNSIKNCINNLTNNITKDEINFCLNK